MAPTWDAGTPQVLHLPSGRPVRGRAQSRPLPGGATPELGLHLLGRRPAELPWAARWLRRPDWRLPAEAADAEDGLREAWRRAARERVEVACRGGRGRTGTALACPAVLDGVPARDAVAFVRQRYDARAVETPWQRRYVIRFDTG